MFCVMLALAVLAAISPASAGPRVSTRPDAPAPGQLLEIQVDAEKLLEGANLEVRLAGRSFPLWPAGPKTWKGLVALGRDEPAGLRDLFVVQRTDAAEVLVGIAELRVTEREYGTQELQVDERMVTLSPDDEARAEKENRRIREVLAGVTRERLWKVPFSPPAPGEISGPFGVRRVFNGKPKNYHNGVDIAAPRGTPVLASAAGKVALVGDFFYTGNTVLVDHGFGLFTAYFHMDSAAAVEGERVEPAAVLGLVGSTGRSTGPHLHWGVYLAGVRVDPVSLFALGR